MRQDVLGRYDRLQDIVLRHHEAIAEYTTAATLLQHAKHLGLTDGHYLFSSNGAESLLVADLCTYAARQGRSRAIDRYARNVRHPADSDEARVLEAMRRARFSIWRIERRHETVGVILSDLLRETEVWFPDADFEDEPVGATFAARLCEPEQFAVACSAPLPVDDAMLEEAVADPLAIRHDDPDAVAQDPRFAAALYRAAIASGVLDGIDAAGDDDAQPSIDVAPTRLAVADASA